MRGAGVWGLWLVAHVAVAAPQPSLESKLETGDLVFQTSRSSQSEPIQRATHSPLSHVGLVEVTPAGVFVVEAVQPVKRTPFAQWRARGVEGHILVLRPQGLDAAQRQRAVTEAKRHLGKPYDARFGWGDDAMYCSELVRKAYARGAGVEYGQMERLDSLDLADVRAALSRRYAGHAPANLELVTPVSLSKDERMTQVFSDFPRLP
ncbi:peptidase [Corallococcus sp. H22C18031201]|nr:peptidase [Corallococcus sp. H22C18031201]